MNQFRYDLFGFCEDHPEYEHTAYIEILSELGTEPLECADVSMFDAKVIIAMLVGACRAERFCDVALLGFMENGAIILWLRRLEEIDASAKAVRMSEIEHLSGKEVQENKDVICNVKSE